MECREEWSDIGKRVTAINKPEHLQVSDIFVFCVLHRQLLQKYYKSVVDIMKERNVSKQTGSNRLKMEAVGGYS
jgi:hypothetical protein